MDGINTLRYSDLFLAMYFDGGKSCLHRNHSHVLVYVYSGEMVIDEKGQITRLHKGECAFIRKDFSVQILDVHHEVPTRLLQQIRSKYSP